ncbi:C40 family peptidase [Gandjariella thermophila]|uniref:Hydrolase Nlp/P60 n=1 Tax=Gandjariella thermophila TaxID=1931992 RepID=A0A4D4J3Q8_9PSEU|nr:C40 family peptidase [Gandjariella thermophila]GDY29712.1 hydrolase Nlp/P60 [Gandjariella thermophila]
MTSSLPKRTTRGALAAGAVVAVAAVASPAKADPNNTQDALQQFQQLSRQAEQVNNDLLKAQDDLKAKQAELDKDNADLAQASGAEQQARAAEDQVRGQVDQLATASYQGARFNQLSALLTSTSARDYLDRAAALDLLAGENNEAMAKLDAATQQAADARKRAADARNRAQAATDAAAKLTSSIAAHQRDLQGQIAQVRQALSKLSSAQKSTLTGSVSCGSVNVGSGPTATALQAALSQCGKPYVWGGSSPSTGFDCSGLTQWAWKQAGVDLPRSASSQYGEGSPVSEGDIQPGDLVFFGSSASSIHHVGIAVGGGKMVDAPTEGVPVGVHTIASYGDFYAAKRL